MHTIQQDMMSGKFRVGYDIFEGNECDFVTLVTCDYFRVAMEFTSYLNGGNPPFDESWKFAEFTDNDHIKE